jgi:hypothetical protein
MVNVWMMAAWPKLGFERLFEIPHPDPAALAATWGWTWKTAWAGTAMNGMRLTWSRLRRPGGLPAPRLIMPGRGGYEH